MALAFIALPLLYKAESYAEIEEGLISSDGMINQHPGICLLYTSPSPRDA